MLNAEFSALVVLFGLCTWFIGHQASHYASYTAGKVALSNGAALAMGSQRVMGLMFLAWFAYMDGIYYAVGLFAFAFAVRLVLVKLEQVFGLTQRAWAISLSGIVGVPGLLSSMVLLVLSDAGYVDVRFGGYVVMLALGIALAIALMLVWLWLVKPLFFPTYT